MEGPVSQRWRGRGVALRRAPCLRGGGAGVWPQGGPRVSEVEGLECGPMTGGGPLSPHGLPLLPLATFRAQEAPCEAPLCPLPQG